MKRFRFVPYSLVPGLLAAAAGCALDHSPRVRLGPHVRLPDASVVLISVDGLNVDVMDELLAAGALPNIGWMIDNGVRVRHAVSGHPSITYAEFASLLTGQYPGHHGILGNKWFDRYSQTFRDYNTIATYRLVDSDFRAPTLYEHLHDELTVSMQCAVRRGATRIVDNWASSGIRWYFGAFKEVDQLMPTRFELVGDLANETGRWPVLIHAYHPATDEIGHRWGPDSAEYRTAIRNADRQIGRIREAVESAGMTERTCFVLVSDHGFERVADSNHFDICRWLRRERQLAVADEAYDNESFEERYRHFAKYDAAVINGGNRRAAIHLRGPTGWLDRPTGDQIERLLGREPGGDAGLLQQPAVLAAARRIEAGAGRSVVELVSRHGASRVTRLDDGKAKQYRYDVVDADALGDWADDELRRFLSEGWHESSEWLVGTAESAYPDVVVQVVEMFDSPRAGDVVVFAEADWDLGADCRGGHGGIGRSEMLIPMVFTGPGFARGESIATARLVDVAPTILHRLRGHAASDGTEEFDGVDLTPRLAAPKRSSGAKSSASRSGNP